MTTEFPDRNKALRDNMAALGKEIPQVMAGFAKLHAAATKDGALDAKNQRIDCPRNRYHRSL